MTLSSTAISSTASSTASTTKAAEGEQQDLHACRTAIITSLHNVYSALHKFIDSFLLDDSYPININLGNQPLLDHSCTRQQVAQYIAQLEYLPGQGARATVSCPGVIGVSESTLNHAQELNEQKKHFKAAMQQFKKSQLTQQDPELSNQIEQMLQKSRRYATEQALRGMGLARLHLKQCYRQLTILPAMPQSIGWTWANTRAIKRISVAQAGKLLLQRGDDVGIQAQLQRLQSLAADEPLAQVQTLAPHLRANVVLAEYSKRRIMVKGTLPLLYLAEKNSAAPLCKHATAQPPSQSAKQSSANNATSTQKTPRADQRLDPNVFLPAIRVHRYHKKPLSTSNNSADGNAVDEVTTQN